MIKIPYTIGGDLIVRDFEFACDRLPTPKFIAELIAGTSFDDRHASTIPEQVTIFYAGSTYSFDIVARHSQTGWTIGAIETKK